MNMKKIFTIGLICAIVSMLLPQCRELDLTADYKDITISYGILNPNDDIHYFKIYRGFITDGNALLEAGDWDKVYYPNYTAPSDTGNAYPAALAVDTAGNAYIVDKGSSNGYDASVNGIYKYNFKSGKVTAMKFVDAGNTLVGLTWLYAVNVDGFGNVDMFDRAPHFHVPEANAGNLLRDF